MLSKKFWLTRAEPGLRLVLLVGLLGANLAFLPILVKATGNYRAEADATISVLQNWYNSSNGQWNTTGWWNSANILEGVIDYSGQTNTTTYRGDISNTYDRNSSGNFLNYYYDDEGWWALAWIKAYDLTNDSRYLNMAKTIFNDLKNGWDTSYCGGGIFWSKAAGGGYIWGTKNAIANELFLAIAARLHNRTPGDGGSGSYLDWAQREWNWFNNSGMINGSNLVNDGLDGSCNNNGKPTYTYNQGVIVGGLVDLYKATNDSTQLNKAKAIANATMTTSSLSPGGILKEPCEPDCGADGATFKGVFMRNLYYLYQNTNTQSYKDYIMAQADSIWNNARNGSNQFGIGWAGPFDSADAARQGSALDAFNAAIAFSSTGTSSLYEAENASSNVSNESIYGGYTGTGYRCCWNGNGQYVTFTVNAASTGSYQLNFRYSAGAGNTTRKLVVNNTTINNNLTFASTGSWSNWSNQSATTATLNAGSNSVTLTLDTSVGNSNYLNLDNLSVISTTPVNLALNKSATGSTACAASETPDKAVDGSTSSKWCSGGAGGQFLQINLGSSNSLGRIVVKHAGAGGENSAWNTKDFNLQVSSTGSSWTTVATVTNNMSNITTHTFSTQNAQYVRLNIVTAQSDPNSLATRIYEVEVYSSEAIENLT